MPWVFVRRVCSFLLDRWRRFYYSEKGMVILPLLAGASLIFLMPLLLDLEYPSLRPWSRAESVKHVAQTFRFREIYHPGGDQSSAPPITNAQQLAADVVGAKRWIDATANESRPLWDENLSRCPKIILLAPGVRTLEQPYIDFTGVHKWYAKLHGFCLLAVECKPSKRVSQRTLEVQKSITRIVKEVVSSMTLPTHPPKFDPQCDTIVDGYHHKLAGLIKILHLSRKQGVLPKSIMYMDANDIVFTAWREPEPIGNHSNVVDFMADRWAFSASSRASQPNATQMQLPLNSGMIRLNLVSQRAASDIKSVFLAAVNLPLSSEQYNRSLRNFWDTDQGTLTYILDHWGILKLGSLADNVTLAEAAMANEVSVLDETRLPSNLVVRLLHPRLMAPTSTAYLQEDHPHFNLTWQPGDWTVHLVPGRPLLAKAKVWSQLCEWHHEDVLRTQCILTSNT